jgi:hypothetical protein
MFWSWGAETGLRSYVVVYSGINGRLCLGADLDDDFYPVGRLENVG